MPQSRKNHPPSLKAKVAIEAIKGHKTTAQIAQVYGVHPTQIGFWKRQAIAARSDARARRSREGRTVPADRTAESGAGLSQKKSWARLRIADDGSIQNTRCRLRGNANC
jgi:transposase-like protein